MVVEIFQNRDPNVYSQIHFPETTRLINAEQSLSKNDLPGSFQILPTHAPKT